MYKTQNGWTKEEMILTIREKMQDHTSQDEFGGCLYRAPDGNKCAVGAFIPDTWDNEDIWDFHSGYNDLVEMFGDEISDFMPLESRGMCDMQELHDAYAIPSNSIQFKEDPRPALIRWINDYVVNA